MTEESVVSNIADGQIIGIQFGLATHNEICKSSISDCPISHASQLANPFLGLPLEIGKCESCGTAELGKCEGHFGYIELPIPVYHPSHISELKRLLGMLCLKCLKLKTSKPVKSSGVMERLLTSCCEETCHISIRESTTNDGASFLELRLPARYKILDGSWNFLEKYGYRYGGGTSRTLLASEVLMILRKLRDETRKKLARKGYFPQDGFILKHLPVPPNCLSVPDVSDGVSVMSSDLSATMLKKVLRQIEIIRSSRSGEPNFESHEVEANELQIAISQYLQVRGTGKAARDADNRYGVTKEGNNSSTKAWLEKMRTLFISKGSGFSSRSVITGDAYKPVNEVGLPSEIAQKMTFEERVNVHNIQYLQGLVDNNLCLTFRDGLSTYSLREGSKGHTFLKLGQVVHRRIMDGDIVFINRPPTTHKHSLQALRVYIHDGHTVKINPLMCGPLAADFDGDCVHLFYPQALSARAEVVELFSVEKQLLSSHSGNLNLQLATDSLLSLKTMFQSYFLDKASIQQLAMYASTPLPSPALLKSSSFGPRWTALQVLQTALPSQFECRGERLLIRASEVVKLDFSWDAMASVTNEILTSLFFNKSPKEALNFFDSLQPLLMENLFSEGFSVGLHDFYVPFSELQSLQSQIQDISPLLLQLRSSFNELVQLQFDSFMQHLKIPVANFILNSSALGKLIDGRSDSAVNKVVQQIGFLGLQLSDKRKFYSKSLVEEVASFFQRMYPFVDLYPSEEFGLVKSCFFRGLDPYEEIVHSIATREVIVRSSKGLAEPGTLFKNLMAILRDVVICYDSSVRNISSNSIIQFEYGVGGATSQSLFPAGEPVGVLAATAMSNPAYKAVLDSSPNSNSSWDMMKEILFCRVNFKNDLNDRRVILYLNDCECGRKHCQERASYLVKNHLQKVSLRDAAVEFLIEYKHSKAEPESAELIDTGLVGHIHLNKALVDAANVSVHEILQKCEDEVNSLRRKKKYGYHFKRIALSVSDCCFFQHSGSKWSNVPCLKFIWQDMTDVHLEKTSHIMADLVCPILLDTIIKGDPRISTVNIVWISSDTTSWVRSPCSTTKGELAVEVTLEKTAVRQNGDAWRIVLDCCHPVFHLIDTTRSIPYAIKQIQDLFGISCAFDQVVQRLSTSVSMVTKGVLKDHLILLASSMTCAGNLVGFNMSGIKALCRALNVQVPFTEATLYTPRKCFERASEKCHVDSLASIVASCSWGKNVAVGTGAKFDLLWDTKESGMENNPVDVYNFLQMVRGSTEEENDAGCLGEDIDKFDWEDAFMEPAMSPDQENKAVFEENIEVGLDSQASGEGDSSWDVPGGKGWNANGNNNSGSGSGKAENGGWSNWGQKKDHSQPEEPSKAGGWDTFKSHNESNPTEPSSSWGKPVKETENAGRQNNDCQQDLKNAEGSSGWDNIVPKETNKLSSSDRWGQPETRQQEPTNAWKKDVGVKDAEGSSGWDNIVAKEPNKLSSLGRWGQPETRQQEPTNAWKKDVGVKNSEGSSGWDNIVANEPNKLSSSDRWGQPQTRQQEPTNSWKKDVEKKKADSTEKDVNPQLGWGSNDGKRSQTTWNSGLKEKTNQPTGTYGWDSAGTDNVVSSKWGQATDSSRKENRLESSDGWNAFKLNERPGSGSWGSDKKEGNRQLSGAHSSWKNSNERADGWKAERAGEEAGSGSWASKVEEGKTSSSWGQPIKSTQSPGGLSSGKANEEAGVKSWESKKQESKTQSSSSWGQPSISTQSPGGWKAEKASEEAGSGSWAAKVEEGKTPSSWGPPSKSTESAGGWKAEKAGEKEGSGSWDSKVEEGKTQSSWGQPSKSTESVGGLSSGEANEEAGGKRSELKKEESKAELSWGKPSDSSWKNSTQSAGGWSSEKGNGEGNASNESESQSQWGQPAWKKKRPEGGRGWGASNSGEWKNKRNRPPKQEGRIDDSNIVAFTATRKRMDIFTPEEQDAVSEIEAIMQSIRRIMHQSGFNDGDPLPADDQSYIINNVLNHHPDKEAKMGVGVDYITVKKHSNFQESRCFYVVSTDGQTQDFSYIKCLGSLIKGKYPSVAESFTSKYFGRSRGGGNRQQDGGSRQQDGGSRQQDWGNRQQDGGNRQQDWGNHQQDWGNRQQDGGNRQQDGGNRQQEGGSQQEDGWNRQQDGGNRQQDWGNCQQDGENRQPDGENHQQE